MKKLQLLCIVLLSLTFAGTALADFRVTATWTDSVDPAATSYQVLLDDVVVVDAIAPGTETAELVITDLSGQAVVVRTLGNTGAPDDYIDLGPEMIPTGFELQTGATGISLQIVYQP